MELDHYCFKAFQSAASVLNFTEAARIAGMTQSGVSQHIAKLEQELGTSLFHRIGKKVALTEAGQKLLVFIDAYYDSVDDLQENIQSTQLSLSGKVRYAMPESCFLSPHFSLLLKEKLKSYPDVELEVDLYSSDEVMQSLLHGRIDFGFVTKKIPGDEIEYVPFCDEEYALVSSSLQKKTELVLKSERWVYYPDCEDIFEAWRANHPRHKKFSFKNFGRSNSLQVALTMVAHDMGVSVFPIHCLEHVEFKGRFQIHRLADKVCANMIYIAYLKSAVKSRRVERVIATFNQMKKN